MDDTEALSSLILHKLLFSCDLLFSQ